VIKMPDRYRRERQGAPVARAAKQPSASSVEIDGGQRSIADLKRLHWVSRQIALQADGITI
jgi:hypothetical protein